MKASLTACAIVVLLCVRGLGQEHQHASPQNQQLGTVSFETSCNAAAQLVVNRAVAWLHSFEFGAAIADFNAALASDRSCGIAEWGIALSHWGNPLSVGLRLPGPLQAGRAAVERARTVGAKTERERAYVEAVAQLYTNIETKPQAARIVAYRDAMATVAATFPSDTEATIFYALSITMAAPPTDKTYADLLKAGAMLEKIVVRLPNHPGLAHYIIHSYDVPPLADRALEAARRYATIAPSASHALHMPSHTFTRLGYWQESIDSNLASRDAARRERFASEELHSLDYLTYAYLQTAQDRAASAIVSSLPEMASRFDPNAVGSSAPGSAGIFALAAIPARYAVERRAWADAARLAPHPSAFPHTEAMTWFARALGAAHTGDLPAVRSALDALTEIRERLKRADEAYWAEQVEIQRRGAAAWLAFAEGRRADALHEMRAAATLEDSTEKASVTPGPIVPARELLGDMLLALKEPAQALKEFEEVLKKDVNRFRAVYGAAEAAAQVGDRGKAGTYYRMLVKISERGDKPGRSEVSKATAFK